MKYAVIDIGSNTVRLCIYELRNDKLTLVLNRRVMALLGSKVADGALIRAGIEAACEALLTLKKFIVDAKPQKTFAFATAALRNISNSKEAVAEIQERTGFLIEVLSGEDEAFLTFSGAAHEQEIYDGVIADIGGGSTELVLIKEGKPVQTASLPIGSLVAFVRFVGKRPATPEQIAAIRSYVRDLIHKSFSPGVSGEVLFGIGGAARTAHELEKILYPASGGAMETLEELLKRLLADEALAEKSILQASPERLDTALPGVAILCEAAAFFGCKRLDVCRAGVREGYMHKKLGLLRNEGA